METRRLQDIVIDRAEFDLGARLPDEIAAENVGMQRPDEDADPPPTMMKSYTLNVSFCFCVVRLAQLCRRVTPPVVVAYA